MSKTDINLKQTVFLKTTIRYLRDFIKSEHRMLRLRINAPALREGLRKKIKKRMELDLQSAGSSPVLTYTNYVPKMI